MKPFFVALFNQAHMADFRVPNYTPQEGRYGWYAQSQDSDGVMSAKQDVWWFDTEPAAQAFAEDIAKTHARVEYAVGQVNAIIQGTPGPVVKSKYTAKGILPF
jgi:hypothetical protein